MAAENTRDILVGALALLERATEKMDHFQEKVEAKLEKTTEDLNDLGTSQTILESKLETSAANITRLETWLATRVQEIVDKAVTVQAATLATTIETKVKTLVETQLKEAKWSLWEKAMALVGAILTLILTSLLESKLRGN